MESGLPKMCPICDRMDRGYDLRKLRFRYKRAYEAVTPIYGIRRRHQAALAKVLEYWVCDKCLTDAELPEAPAPEVCQHRSRLHQREYEGGSGAGLSEAIDAS